MQSLTSPTRITVIGAGPSGCLLSLYLARQNFCVDIYEKRPDPRQAQVHNGRSINLTLAARGIQALKEVGIHDSVIKLSVPLKGRVIHTADNQIFQSYGLGETDILYALRRLDLSILLLNEVEKFEQIRIFFNQTCTGVDLEKKILHLQDSVTFRRRTVSFGIVIGADGAASSVRTEMLKTGTFTFSRSYLKHGYKEVIIPANQEVQNLLRQDALHVWPRRRYMLNGFPNLDGSTTCVLFAPLRDDGLENLSSESQALKLFQREFPDLLSAFPSIAQDFLFRRIGHLSTVECYPWHFKDEALLIGDAAHAIVPFHGQGVNCAFEDCACLVKCIEMHGNNWQKIFQEFENLRKINTDAIADLSFQNYDELREHVGNQKFHLKKQAERLLAEHYPNYFIPRFSMVCFHQIPYSIAQQRGTIQQKIIEILCEPINDIDEIDLEKAEQLIKEHLVQLCLP